MKQEVISIAYEFKIHIRVKLACGHWASTNVADKYSIKKRYICHACRHKEERKMH